MVNDLTLEELLTQTNPVLDPEKLRLASAEVETRCASILERRGAMRTQTPTTERLGSAGTPRRSRKPVLAFVVSLFAVITGLGVTGYLLGGGESTSPADTAPASSSDPTPATTTPPTSSADAPAAPTTTPVATPTTTAASSGEIPAGPFDPFAWNTRLAVSPDGGFVAVYWSESNHELRMYRCRDAVCAAPETIVLGLVEPVIVEGDELGPYPEEIVFRPDGSPIVLVQGGDAGQDFTLYACDDPDCSSILTAPFDEASGIREPRLAVAPDGNPRIVYFDLDDESLKLAVCADSVCEIGFRATSTVQVGIHIPYQLAIRIEPDGRTFFEYDTGETTTQARVAVCADDRCSAGPTIFTFDDGIMPRTTALDDNSFLVWYRSGPAMLGEGDTVSDAAALEAWDLVVTECTAAACGEAQQIDVGSKVLEWWFVGGRDELRLLLTSDETFLVHSYWSSYECGVLLDAATIDLQTGTIGTELGTYMIDTFTAAVTDDDEPLLLFQDAGGELRLINLDDDTPEPNAPLPNCSSP
jgi:hypothetical protein